MGKTLFGSLGKTVSTFTNRSPIALAPTAGRSGLITNYLRPAGQEAQMRAMGSVGTLFAIVERITTSYSQVEWKLYRSAKSGRPEDRVEVTSHAALDLWNQPNPFMTGPQWREATQQHEELTGEQWWIITKDERFDIPLELWFARPDRMVPIPDRDTFLSGYKYSSPTGEQVPLELDDVIMLRRPNPLDPYRGWGPVQTLLADLDSSRASAEWNANFFRNSAQPGGIVQASQRLSDDEFNEFRDRWNEQHRGVQNAHRVALLENGLEWVDRSYSMADMQFAELRNASREVIREAFAFPKPMLGTVDDANRANMEAAVDMFSRWLIRPRLRRIQEVLNTRLLPMYGAMGKGLEFDFEDPVTGDVEMESKQLTAQSGAAAQLVAAGFDPADVLSAVGLPEIAFTGAPAARALPPAPPEPAAAWTASVSGLLGSAPAIRNASSDTDQMRRDHEAALAALLLAFAPVEDDWIVNLGIQIEQAVNAADAAALAALSLDSTRAADVVRTALEDAAQQAADRMADEARRQGMAVAVPQVAGLVTAIASAVAALIASNFASTAAQEAVRRFLPGVSAAEVAAAVKSMLRTLKGTFKRDQLGGAVHRAQNTGRIATLKAAPTARWIASEANDINTCQPCAAVDGTEFTTLDEVTAAYGAGSYIDCEGGIRCRGTVEAFWDQGDNG
ncbi:phage portal protein [Streptomyces sp. NPDC127038]|uniref:phage portal protein n=1 Tax=Streptomyces sp. NPDC127038 TaxID=3347114 RepID=UPI003662541A